MDNKSLLIIWGSIVLIIGIISGGITVSSLYGPRSTMSALDQCAQYEQSRNSIFCYELVRNQSSK